MTEEELSDIMVGEVHDFFLLTALEAVRNLDNGLKRQERDEIWEVLKRNYGTRNLEDACRVLALYRKYNIGDRVKRALRRDFIAYEQSRDEAYAV